MSDDPEDDTEDEWTPVPDDDADAEGDAAGPEEGSESEREESDPAAGRSQGEDGETPFRFVSEAGEEATGDVDPAPESGGEDGAAADEAVPMSELAEALEEGDLGATPEAEELFERKQKPEVDREALWRQVTDEETAERVVEEMDAEETPGVRRGDRDRSAAGEGERVVEKSTYCHSCRFFSAPPDVRCTHEGTEIVEAVDVDHFRVRDCPVVAENEELEEF